MLTNARQRRRLWRIHNAIKVAANVAAVGMFAVGSDIDAFRACFLLSAAYEIATDPFVLERCGRDQMVADTAVHHAFVLAWAFSAWWYRIDPPTGVAAVALARTAMYGGVFVRSVRPAASIVVAGQFAYLVIDAFRRRCAAPVFATCQATFVVLFAAYQALKKSEIGILIVTRGPVVRPIWTPTWATTTTTTDAEESSS